jgi:CRISPR/Cas system-associated endonuclease Cas1
MSWRTVVITSRCKLDFKMGYMVVRAEETKKVLLDEIAVLLIENPAVSLTVKKTLQMRH